MKLSISFLLITLAVFCSEANAIACPLAVLEATKFLTEPDFTYKLYLQFYKVPPEDIKAKLQVKQCANELSIWEKALISKVVVISLGVIFPSVS
ncbi:PREDICTED: secretoglobin family 1D member-like [Elephantulus edwardii]|uniref:secretoglobin family 1D member-like n=1 Tax=Elephantulus edwardii TaxID=28737 RepID=UPI0003F0A429|nr:PREDICTED: secretoglobin family 1D member-like [Elephantulus edwardii]